MKGLSQIKSIRSVKNIPRTRSAKPKNDSTEYLNLYVLTVERERLTKELAVLDRRRGEVDMRLKSLNDNIASLIAKRGMAIKPAEDESKKWKTVSLKY
ncbi:MAG: hypothetical protein IAF08_09400 [Rhizobacter sp.]|nr:hypothetical protein [Chlorobiales bacterium]